MGSEILLHSLAGGASSILASGLPPCRYLKEAPDLLWTSDGRRIIYVSGKEYFTISVDGGVPKLLISGVLLGELIQLSPDQNKISFIRDGDLWIQSVDGGAPQMLTQGENFLAYDAELFTRLYQWPQCSPDSTKIAYLSSMEQGH